MSIEDFEAQVGSVLAGKKEPIDLLGDLQEFHETAFLEQKKRFAELIKLLLEHRILKKIKDTRIIIAKFVAKKRGVVTLDDKPEYLSICDECGTMNGDIDYWIETYGEDYSFIVVAAIKAIREYIDAFLELSSWKNRSPNA